LRTLTVLLMAVLIGPARAQSGAGSDDPRFAKGAHAWTLGAGFGVQHRIFNGTSDQQFALVQPRWSVNLTGRSGEGWKQGTLTLGLEAALGRALGPRGNVVALGPMLRYSFPSRGRVTPFVEAAGSFFWTNAEMPETPQRFTFTGAGGGGLSWRLGARDSFELAYRFHHISNAGFTEPNIGVNSSFVLIGWSRAF